ncbi:MAG TPA: aminotransferase class IV [Saprospiraceae bacterium]|nr:aminotransferase class IV [Saprospiraceae bacterium]
MTKLHFLNGQILPQSGMMIPVSDISVGRGYGVFDYFQMRKGVPFHMEHHIDRFFQSAEGLRLSIPFSKEDIIQGINSLIEKNHLQDAGIKLLATGGVSPDGFMPGIPNVAILVLDYMKPSTHLEDNGIALLSYRYQRELPHVKSTNYLLNVYLQRELKEAGALEPLYYTEKSVTETARANVFAVINGKLVTPAENMLKGINRQIVIDTMPFEVIQKDITLKELKEADEVFCTGTTKRAIGVTRIDNDMIGNGKPGSITSEIRQRIIDWEENYISSQRHLISP